MNKPFPLDYIINMPRHLSRPDIDSVTFSKSIFVENTLKNVVIRRLSEIRAFKSKPSLKDMID